jgi:hypothetical protein
VNTIIVAVSAIQTELKNVITSIATAATTDVDVASTDPAIEDIQFLSYLGNNEQEASTFLSNMDDSKGVGFDTIHDSESPQEKSTSAVGFAFAIGIPIVLAIIGSLFFAKRRRTSIILPNQNVLQSWEEYDPSNNIVKGTGDPPDSYHDGLYHYMFHGQKYLSTRCALCLETKRNSQLNANALRGVGSAATEDNYIVSGTSQQRGQGDDNDEDNTHRIVNVTSNLRLGQRHMGMDVHVCNSATCMRCFQASQQQPMFVPTGVVKHRQDSQDNISSSSSSLSSASSELPQNNSIDNYDIESHGTKSTYSEHVRSPAPPRRGRRNIA